MWTDLGWFIYQLEVQIQFDPQLLACAQALWSALVVGWEKEGKLTTMSQEFEIHLQFPCSSPLTELSDFRQSAQSGNEHECKQTWAKGNGVITNVISANQHFTSAFLMGIFKFQRHCCKLFFPFPPCRQNVTESLPSGYSAAWPPAFLFLSFSTLCSSSLKRTDIIVPSKLNKPSLSNKPSPSNGLLPSWAAKGWRTLLFYIWDKRRNMLFLLLTTPLFLWRKKEEPL